MTNHESRSFIERMFPYNHNIGHDHPDAEEELKHKLSQLVKKQDLWKKINAIIRKSSKEPVIAMTAICKLDDRLTHDVASGLLQPDFCGRVGIPSFELTNNNAGMKAVQDRLAKIQRVESMPEFDQTKNDVRIWIDKDENRIFVEFNGRPESSVIDHLKHYGFRWRPTEKVWSGNIDKYRLERAKKVWDMVPQTDPIDIEKYVESEISDQNQQDMDTAEMIAVLSGEVQTTTALVPVKVATVEYLM